jgi:hypothetical protein
MNKKPRMLSLGLVALVSLAGVMGTLLIFSQASKAEPGIPAPTGRDVLETVQAQAGVPQVIATVTLSPGVGIAPGSVGVNPATGYVYVANSGSYDVTVISGTSVITTWLM